MTKKTRAFFIWFALMLAVAGVAAGPPETGFRAVMDKGTAQLFSEIPAPGQELMERIWDRMLAEGSPRHAWEGHVVSHIKAIHEAVYGEDGRQEGELAQSGCSQVVSTSIQYLDTDSLTGSFCPMDFLRVNLHMWNGFFAYDVCDDCYLAYARLAQPTQHGYATASGVHEWQYPAGGGASFDQRDV